MRLKDIIKNKVDYKVTFDDKFVYIEPTPNRMVINGLRVKMRGGLEVQCDVLPGRDYYSTEGLPKKIIKAELT